MIAFTTASMVVRVLRYNFVPSIFDSPTMICSTEQVCVHDMFGEENGLSLNVMLKLWARSTRSLLSSTV